MSTDLSHLLNLKGQVAIVTGAGAGIGRAIAQTFAQAGAAVMVSDRTAEAAAKVAEGINADGGKAISVACDVTDEAAREAMVNETVKAFGKVTLLVNNAGGGGPKPFDMPMSDFEWAYQLNVFSLFRLCQLCAPHIEKAGGGAVLNISSMAGENKNQRMTSYGSSKAAVNHLTRNMAFDLGPKKIRVNAIAPGGKGWMAHGGSPPRSSLERVFQGRSAWFPERRCAGPSCLVARDGDICS